MLPDFSDKVVRSVFRRLLKDVKSPYSDALGAHLVRGDDLALSQEKCPHPAKYEDAISFRDDYCLGKILSKWKGLKTGINTSEVALDAWISVELGCARTNVKLRSFIAAPHESGALIRARIVRAQEIIQRIIGPAPNVERISGKYRISNGATFRTRRGTPVDKKLSVPIAVTRECVHLLHAELMNDPAWLEATFGSASCPLDSTRLFEVVKGSRTITVPKDAKTDRTIGVEPFGNSFLQQGVHAFLRERLLRNGVDLDDQSINQRLASKAQAEGLATLDLKSASDSICSELVFLLLPIEWALYLDRLRTRETLVRDRWVRLEKFSAMGNAFTFELESLIFYALISAVKDLSGSQKPVSVYGDDLIVGQEIAGDCVELLEWCGFQINEDKSFLSGRFFESCGMHYFDGIDVTPVYQKEIVSDLSEHIRFHNRVMRWLLGCQTLNRYRLARSLWRYAMDQTDDVGRTCLLPEDAPDDRGFLTCNGWVTDWPYCPNHGLLTNVWVFVPNTRRANDAYLLAYKYRVPAWASARPDGRAAVSKMGGTWRMLPAYVHTTFEVCTPTQTANSSVS